MHFSVTLFFFMHFSELTQLKSTDKKDTKGCLKRKCPRRKFLDWLARFSISTQTVQMKGHFSQVCGLWFCWSECFEDSWKHRWGANLAKNNTGKTGLSFLKKKKKYTKKQNKKPFAALKGSKTARKTLRQKVRVKVTRQDQTVVMTLMQQCQELESKAIHPWTKSSYSSLKSYQK